MKTLTKDKIDTINKIMKYLDKLDKLIVYDGLADLIRAKEQLVLLKTIITVEDEMNEN